MTISILKHKNTRSEFLKTSAALEMVAAVGDKLFGGPVSTLIARTAPEAVGEEKWVPFYCQQCGMGPDPARARVVNGVVVKIEGDPRFRDKLTSPSLICVKAEGLVQKLYNPYRIKAPMKRTNPKKGMDEDPKFVEISWDEALSILTDKLKEVRKKGVVNEEGVPRVAQISQKAPSGASYQGVGWRPFWAAWGPTDGLGGGGGAKCYHAEHVYGELWRRSFVSGTEFRLCNYQILFGRNQNATAGAPRFNLYADARMRGMKQISISPDLNVTAAKADEWIPIKPKTDAAFLFAMINIILHEMDWRKVCDIDFLKKMTNSPYLIGPKGYYVRELATKKPLVWGAVDKKAKVFDDPTIKDFALEGTYTVAGTESGPDEETYTVNQGTPSFQLLIDHVKGYTPEWASKITEVPAETIRRITREFVAQAMVGATIEIDGMRLPYRPVSIDLGKAVNNGWGSYQCVWAQHVLSILVGALEVPGGNLGYYSVIYQFVPLERDADGFLLSAIHPTDKKKWEWPPKDRQGIRTLTPLSGGLPRGPTEFGASTLGWKTLVEPLEKWPSSVPDINVFQRCDPVSSNYESNLIRKGLEKIPFTVSIAYNINESNWYADLILPESLDIESLQLDPVPRRYKGAWEYRGWAIRQPVVKPLLNTRDVTDIYTELADRLGMLPAYNSSINAIEGLKDTPWELDPMKKYSVEEIVDRQCKAKTKGKYDLEWFKENGMALELVSKLTWYLHVKMTELRMRYRLPYQEDLRRVGEELKRRLHEVGIHWWDNQAEEYTHPLPKWENFRAIYEEVFQAGPEYDMWLTCHRAHQLAWAQNADVPWIIESLKDTLDVPGVVINSETARKKGIKHGDKVCLESRFGKTYASAIVAETVRPDTLVVCEHFSTFKTPIQKDLGWPNMNETQRIDVRLHDETGAPSDHAIVKIYKV